MSNKNCAHFDRKAAAFLGGALRIAREDQKLPIGFATMVCGLSKGSVSNIERGLVDVSLSNYVALCEAYGLDAGTLLKLACGVREAARNKGEGKMKPWTKGKIEAAFNQLIVPKRRAS